MSIFKKNTPEFKRMVFSELNEKVRVEISYNAGVEIGKGNPPNTDVIIRGADITETDSIIWEKKLGDVTMPTGAWHGLSLIVFNFGNVIIGCSNVIYCLDVSSGEIQWKKEFENFLVTELKISADSKSIYVYFSMFDFNPNISYGNISKLSMQGELLWNVEKPANGKLYTNQIFYLEGSLVAATNDSHLCFIDERTGSINKRVFSKT